MWLGLVFGVAFAVNATLDAIAWNDEMALEDITTTDQGDWFGPQPPQP